MKIAIHHKEGSFSAYWIAYCQRNGVDYKVVNAYDIDIIQQVKDCDAFMWHHYHDDYRDAIFAKQLLYSLQVAGKKVFPDFNSCWHFDDKVGQKYLLESIEVPLIPSYTFYDKKSALAWINKTTFPKVFKLRGGASSANVRLVKSKTQAIQLTNKAFGSGFSLFDKWGYLKEQCRKYKVGKGSLRDILRGVKKIFVSTEFAKMSGSEKGYIYFQDFIPNNTFDTRIVVIDGRKAFGERRFVRENDFRASGSGDFCYDNIDTRIVKMAFDISKKLKLQSVAFDFVVDLNQKPLIVEMSYGFGIKGIKNANGYWDSDMNWHEGGTFDFCGEMVERLIRRINI